MEGNLIIVESPHKAKLIQEFLGREDYKVVSSKGHIRDLEDKGMSIDIEHGFIPKYVVSKDKKALVSELRKLSDKAGTVWLASDPDREGEAIAWHLAQVLDLPAEKTKRITYNEITKDAVLEAIGNPRSVDMNLVNAQQARRVLDRLVGFELSPILWRKIRKGLSAGRVQSVTLRLAVDREREIAAFVPRQFYSVSGKFLLGEQTVTGHLESDFKDISSARTFLEDSVGAQYKVGDIDRKEGSRFPAPPFTTSTMLQEAARKLHFTSSRTMRIAQSLYERGYITYMRTDSTNLSSLAINTAKQFICDNFGSEYSKPRNYKTKSKGAQEAHEAIRPTFISNTSVSGTAEEQKLYNLIWKRAVASQMAEAKVLGTTIKLDSDRRSEKFLVKSTEVLFDGFLKLYLEGRDDEEDLNGGETIITGVSEGQKAACKGITASCKYTQPPFRYSEQTLMKKMEELGIGRPSTYAPTVTTLTSGRGYLVTADKEGTPVEVVNLSLEAGAVKEKKVVERIGAEKRKLIPTDVGMMVTDYLIENFPAIMNYDFTADVEGDFDEIAKGAKIWTDVIGGFYSPFHGKVETALANKEFSHMERELGTDPSDGKKLVAKFGQYGPYVQKGEGEDKVFASLGKGQLIESITLEDALKLFQLPRTVGEHEGIPVVVTTGRFGPYIRYGKLNVSIPRGTDPLKTTLEECVSLIGKASDTAVQSEPMKEFKESDIAIINGRYGPYIKHAGANYRIPKGTDASTLTEKDCLDIIAGSPAPATRKFRKFKKR